MHVSNWKKKPLQVLTKKKNNCINVIGDKFGMSIRLGNITILFCKKLFSCINYLQLFM